MRVFLVGFMGVGKTTVGRVLAQQLGVPFFDLDEEVEATVGRSIPEIFEEHGETWFRERESAELRSVLRHPAAVVATGGGLPTLDRNRKLLKTAGATVWLDLPFDVLCQRIAAADQPPRPLFRDPESARQLFLSRVPAYARADHRLTVSGEDSPAELAERIAQWLGDGPCAS